MSRSLTEVSGYLVLEGLSTAQMKRLQDLRGRQSVILDFSERFIELEYKGRNSSHFLESLLVEIASTVGSAEGGIVFEIEPEEGDRRFQFFSVRGGRLSVQNGSIARGPQTEYSPA